MSFAYDVKSELAQRTGKPDLLRAQGYGLFLFSRAFSAEQIIFQTEHDFAAQVASDFLRSQHVTAVYEETKNPANGVVVYRLKLEPPETGQLMKVFRCEGQFPINDSIFTSPKALSFFLGGAFLACGNITDPQKAYHLEFAPKNAELADILEELVDEVTECRQTTRLNQPLVYLKNSEQIADLLTFIGATRASMALMETKIEKDIRNRTNRQVNCDTANLSKTAAAAVAQTNDIQLITELLGWEAFPEELRVLAHARLDNPDASLRELGESLVPPVSRSGIAHRFARITEMAAELRRKADNNTD